MKKNLIALAIVSVAALVGSNRTNAQMISNSSSLEYQMNTAKPKNSMNKTEEINPKALKNFKYAHKNITDESWTKLRDGFSVRFISDGIKTTICYDKKGKWFGSIKIYSEEKLLREVRHVVKSTYYDYNIVYTEEIETNESNGVPTYIVCVEDNTKIKMIRVIDGEMSEWKEFIKVK